MKPKIQDSSSDGVPALGQDPKTLEANRRTEPLLDSNEAAGLLGIHPKTLQRMARRREVPGLQIGKLWRFRMSELNAWLREKIAG